MKLPDFFADTQLNKLRSAMGIPEKHFGSILTTVDPSRLTREQLDQLTSGEGIDIKLPELTILPDGTFAYKDHRVLVYIRDIQVIDGKAHNLPKYHFMTCQTIEDMQKRKKHEKYVANSRNDGVFHLNLITKGKVDKITQRLNVCQNCLSGITFDGFDSFMPRDKKQAIVEAFTPENFFKVYPGSLHRTVPEYSWENSPIDDYTRDFPEISRKKRAEAGWRCQSCSKDLSSNADRRFLHIHHIGRKDNNSAENLKVLCIACHAKEENHSHLQDHPDYKSFEKKHIGRPPKSNLR